MDVRDAALRPAERQLRRYHPMESVINVLFRDYNSERSAYVSIHAFRTHLSVTILRYDDCFVRVMSSRTFLRAIPSKLK